VCDSSATISTTILETVHSGGARPGHRPGWKRPGPGCAPVDEMGQNLRVRKVPQSKFWCPAVTRQSKNSGAATDGAKIGNR
jgi:hypothetical protein